MSILILISKIQPLGAMLNLNKVKYREFSLIELLVVITIFAILLTILLPTLDKARSKAQVMTCKSNMKQVGTGILLYMSNNGISHPLPFQSGTGDHPSEGKPYAKGTLFPGNAAIYTSDYFESKELMVDTFFCSLVDTNNEKFNMSPAPGGRWQEGDGIWSTYVYLYGKSLARNDPYFEERQKYNFTVNFIRSVNEVSEKVVLTDYPQQRATWMPKWNTRYEHYNALMHDGSVKEPSRTYSNLNLWLWGISTWPAQ